MGFSRWSSKGKRNAEKKNSATLSDIIRGLQFCVNSSAEIMQQHYLTAADKYTDEDKKLLTKRFKIGDGYYMDVPLICLSDHHSLYIDELNVKMNVNVNDMDLKEAQTDLNGGGENFSVTRSCFNVELGSAKDEKYGRSNIGINIKFKATEPPEAFARLIEKLDNMIIPEKE